MRSVGHIISNAIFGTYACWLAVVNRIIVTSPLAKWLKPEEHKNILMADSDPALAGIAEKIKRDPAKLPANIAIFLKQSVKEITLDPMILRCYMPNRKNILLYAGCYALGIHAAHEKFGHAVPPIVFNGGPRPVFALGEIGLGVINFNTSSAAIEASSTHKCIYGVHMPNIEIDFKEQGYYVGFEESTHAQERQIGGTPAYYLRLIHRIYGWPNVSDDFYTSDVSEVYAGLQIRIEYRRCNPDKIDNLRRTYEADLFILMRWDKKEIVDAPYYLKDLVASVRAEISEMSQKDPFQHMTPYVPESMRQREEVARVDTEHMPGMRRGSYSQSRRNMLDNAAESVAIQRIQGEGRQIT